MLLAPRRSPLAPCLASAGTILTAAMFLSAAFAPAARAVGALPGRGSDTFESVMEVVLEIGEQVEIIQLEGPTTIFRNDPVPGTGGDPCTVEIELVAMRLAGDSPFGRVEVTNRADVSSTGLATTTEGSACEFPTDVFFDVFVEVDVEILQEPLINLEGVRVQASNVLKFPPLFDTHTHPPPSIPLFLLSNLSTPFASIAGNSTHTPLQRVTFSIDDARASTLIDPADLLEIGNPPAARIPKENIGLQTNDNLDALSYGLDVIDAKSAMDVYFSVDPSAQGAPNTGVDREAQNDEAEGDEFISYLDGNNLEVLDEEAVVLVPAPASPADDIDALTNQPTSAVDNDGNGTPERPVFFSLEAGSPTLTALSASPADILVWDPMGPGLAVYASATDMGLVAGDELDALCLMKPDLPRTQVTPGAGGPATPMANVLTDFALFSLAPGSPSLTSLGASPGDLLLTNFNGAWLQFPIPPIQYITASELGLLTGDNLNALKCEIESVTFLVGPFGGTAKTAGFVTIQVGAPGNDGDPDVSAPAPGQPGYFPYWFTVNPFHFVFDFHGPFFLPGAPNTPPTADILDYEVLEWRNNEFDVCPDPHLHDTPNLNNKVIAEFFRDFFPDTDPDGGACGHGKLVKGLGGFFEIPEGESFIEIAARLEAAILATEALEELEVTARMHLVDPDLFAKGGGAGAGPASQPGAAVIIMGTGRTKIDVSIQGADGIEITGPETTLPVPLLAPEPGAAALAAAALATLCGLQRRRSRRGPDA